MCVFCTGKDGVNLMRSKDFGKTWKLIHKDVQSFGIEGKFLYASVTVPGVSSLCVV